MKFNYLLNIDIYKIKITITTLMIRALLETIDDKPYLSIYLFNKRIYFKRYILKQNRNTIFDMLYIIKFNNLNTEICYGFNNPCITGQLCVALSAFPNVDQNPNFIPQYEYIIIDGNAHLYVWKTIINYFKYKRKGTT